MLFICMQGQVGLPLHQPEFYFRSWNIELNINEYAEVS